jgi:hypothetical protein
MKEIEQLRRENRKLWLAVILLLIVGTFTYAMLITTRSAGAQNITVPAVKPNAGVIVPKLKQYMILPPVQYDRYYEGDLTIMMVKDVDDLRAACGLNRQAYPNVLACSIQRPRACLIILVDDEVMRKRGWTTGLLLRHEMGHCNGWPGDHPGERGLTAPSTHWVPEHERPRTVDGR